MAGERVERRLAAVLAADVVGYSRLMGADELGTLAALKAHRRDVVDPSIAEHHGRIVKTIGDGLLVEFASAVDAVTCAMAVQAAMAERNAGTTPPITFRIGINVGDVIIDGDDIFGDGVNIAARVETACEPGSVCLSGNAFEQIRGKTGFVFHDRGEQALKNIDRPVRIYIAEMGKPTGPDAAPSRQQDAAAPLALPEKPSIAVLPFQNMSGDPEQEYFADGLVEDIITALSRYKSLFVIARNSSFTYKGRAVDIKQVGRELGVRYVLEGSVRKAASRLRITGQLIDAATGAHLWAEKFDGMVEDVFELQDRVASSVVGIISPVLLEAEISRASARPTDDLTAYDLYLRAVPQIRKWSREGVGQAIVLLRQAVARDPVYGMALATLAFSLSQNIWSGWSTDVAADVAECQALSRRARTAAPGDPEVIGFAAGALMNLGDDIDMLKGLIDAGLVLNPSSAMGWFWSGWMHTMSGECDLAIAHFATSRRLDPRAPHRAFHLTGTGICHFFSQRFEQAAADLQASFQELPSYPTTQWFLAACHAQMGHLDVARGFAARSGLGGRGLQMLESRFGRYDPARLALLLDGARLAISA